MILLVAYNNESLENNFSSFVNFVGSEVIRTKTRKKSHDCGNKRNVSKFQTKNSGGKGGGNSNIRNPNNNNHNGQPRSNSKEMKVDDMWIFNCYHKNFAKNLHLDRRTRFVNRRRNQTLKSRPKLVG